MADVIKSQSTLYSGSRQLDTEQNQLKQRLIQRIQGVHKARESKYVMLHAPKKAVDAITDLLPSAESPTILPLEGQADKVAMHTLCREGVFWEHLEDLKAVGATAILVLPVEKMLA